MTLATDVAAEDHHEPARLGDDVRVLGKEARDLGVDFSGQDLDGFHVPMVGSGEAAADVKNLDLLAVRLGLPHHAGGDVKSLDEVLEIHALAADVEAQSFHHQTEVARRLNQRLGFAGIGPEFR